MSQPRESHDLHRQPPAARNAEVSRVAILSIVVAVFVLASKTLAWWLTGSVALYSDALESILNVATAAVAWWSIRIAALPPDDDHHYGHHKAEYMSAIVVGVLIVISAFLIFREAWLAIDESRAIRAPWSGIALAALAALVNGIWSRRLLTLGRAAASPALLADGRHLQTDVITSIGVIAGLLLTIVTGWVLIDAIVGLLVGVNVLREGWRLILFCVDGLMDKAAPDAQHQRIRELIRDNAAGAIEAHDIKSRIAGPSLFVEFHLVVDGEMRVARSHAICDRLEHALEDEFPGAKVTIHVEPLHKLKGHHAVSDAVPIEPI